MLHCAQPPTLAAALLLAAAPAAQVAWRSLTGPEPRAGTALAFDAARGETVLFGGAFAQGWSDETWTFDGATWRLRDVATRPPARADTALAYDPVRQRIVLFGGGTVRGTFGNYVGTNDTWEWDGTAWTQAQPTASPPARAQHAMAFDPARGRILMAGGMRDGLPFLGDVWEWDGTTWSQVTATPPPLLVARPQLVTDSGRGLVVYATQGACHEWDGVRWSQRAAPPQLVNGELTLAYDSLRRRVQALGVGSAQDELWEYDGASWTRASVMPSPRRNPGAAYDSQRARTVLFGDNAGSPAVSSRTTWLFDGTRWSEAPAVRVPDPRDAATLASDVVRRRVVLFGGLPTGGAPLDDLWEWDGAAWIPVLVSTRPAARHGAMFAYDRNKQRHVLFGGSDQTWWRNDTWEWNGAVWVARTPATSPSPRASAGLVRDPTSGSLLLFGGLPAGGNETWSWDGTTWTLLTPSTAPSARSAVAMAPDELRSVVVLFGGRSASVSALGDTWVWAGGAWSQRNPGHKPPARAFAACAWDPLRGRVVLHGGEDGNGALLADTWEWDGTDWNEKPVLLDGWRTTGKLMAFDHARGRMLLLKSAVAAHWEYASLWPATATPFGLGCAATAGPATLAAVALPWIGDRVGFAYTPAIGGRAAYLTLGGSRRTYAGLPLPYELGPMGMPGCSLFTSIDVVVPFPAPRLDLPIPADASLVGSTFHAQATIADPAANTVGLLTSNALAAVFGQR